MHRGFCQSVKGLKKSFDAELADTVSTVKTEIVYRGKQGQKTNELMREIGGYHEENVIIMTEAEYEALTSGKSLILDIKYLEFFKLIRSVADDAIAEGEGA